MTNPTTFSSGTNNHQINQLIEKQFKEFECALTKESLKPVSAFSAGLKRTLFGLAQIIGTVFCAIVRSCQAGYQYEFGDKKFAALYAQEALRSVTYLGHGLANIGRGIAEFVHIALLVEMIEPPYVFNNMYLAYQSEKAEILYKSSLLDTATPTKA